MSAYQTQRLQKYREWLTAETPLIGGWLRRRAISSLIEDGSTEATIALAEAAMRGLDEVDPLTAGRYAPRDSVQRALFYFLTGRWEEYESLDFDHAFLRTAYETGDERLRGRIAQRARRDGRIEWVEIVTGGWRKKRLGEMSGEEWEATLAAHLAGGRWEELWRLAQEAPPRWSAQILRRMNGSGWSLSSEDEQRECEALMEPAVNWEEPDLYSSATCEVKLESEWPVYDLAINSSGPSGSLMTIEVRQGAWRSREWSLPSGQLTRTLEGTWGRQRDLIKCLAMSPGGRLLAIVKDGSKTVQTWSLTDGRLIKRLKEDRYYVDSIAASSDGRLLVSVTSEKTWKSDINDEMSEEQRLVSITEAIKMTLSAWGFRMFFWFLFPVWALLYWCFILAEWWGKSRLIPQVGCEMRLWSLPEGRPLKTIKAPQQNVSHLAISPDGGMLVSGGGNSAVQLRRLPDGQLIKTLEGQRDMVTCFAFSPDGQLLAGGGEDGIVRLWGLPDGKLIKTLELERDSITSKPEQNYITRLAFSQDGRLLAGVVSYGSVRLWSLPDGKLVKILDCGKPPYVSDVTCLTFSPDGDILASGCEDGTVRLWTSNLLRLSKLPVAEASRSDFDWVQGILRDEKPSGSERQTLEFMAALMRLRRRFEIEVDEPTRRAEKYDIEIGD
jgi:WD40 repeat protein